MSFPESSVYAQLLPFLDILLQINHISLEVDIFYKKAYTYAHLLKAQRGNFRQPPPRINYTDTILLFLPSILSQVRTERLPAGSSAVFLFTFQTRSVLLLPQPPPVQVSSTLETIHSGSKDDDEADRHQLRGQPTLQGKNTQKNANIK